MNTRIKVTLLILVLSLAMILTGCDDNPTPTTSPVKTPIPSPLATPSADQIDRLTECYTTPGLTDDELTACIVDALLEE